MTRFHIRRSNSHRMDQAVEEYPWFASLIGHYRAMDRLTTAYQVHHPTFLGRVTALYPESTAKAFEEMRLSTRGERLGLYNPQQEDV